MPRKDTIHDAVKNALIKDGWNITHDPYIIKYGDEKVLIDLAAELPLAAERDGQQIAIEIKSFIGQSPMNDLENAMGQISFMREFCRTWMVTANCISPLAARSMTN